MDLLIKNIRDDRKYYNIDYKLKVSGKLKNGIEIEFFVIHPLTNVKNHLNEVVRCLISIHKINNIQKKTKNSKDLGLTDEIIGLYLGPYEIPDVWLTVANNIMYQDYYHALEVKEGIFLLDPKGLESFELIKGDKISIKIGDLELRAWSTINEFEQNLKSLENKKLKEIISLQQKKECKINDYIKITLQKEELNFLKNKKFELICSLKIKDKWFVCGVEDIEFPLDDINDTDSLDNTADQFDKDLKIRFRKLSSWSRGYKDLKPEQKYEIYCNNLKAWKEHNYDSRLFRCSYVFKLLKKLWKEGDPLAMEVFRKEIIKRILSGYSTVIKYLLNYSFLKYLSDNQIYQLINDLNSNFDVFLSTGYQINKTILWTKFGKYLKKKRSMELYSILSDVFYKKILANSTNIEVFCSDLIELEDDRFSIELIEDILKKSNNLDKSIENNINFILCINNIHLNILDRALDYYDKTKRFTSRWSRFPDILKKLKELEKLKGKLSKYWKNSLDTKNFMNKLISLLNLPDSSTINEILEYISQKGDFTSNLKNRIFQYLRKVQKQKPEFFYTIRSFLKSVKKTKFKTFKFIISDAFKLDTFQGGVQIYLNNKKILSKDYISSIRVSHLMKGVDQDMDGSKSTFHESDEILVTGCGFYGCCPGLNWRLIHDGEYVIIDNITWDSSKPEECIPIEGVYRVHLDDYRSEALRLEQIYKKAAEKKNIIQWKKPSKKGRNKFK